MNTSIQAGDIIAVESRGLVAWFIRRAQRRVGFTKEQSKVTHIAVAINRHGDLLEAEGGGIRLSNIEYYRQKKIKYHVLRHVSGRGEEIADMALRLSHSPDFLAREYDFLLIAGLLLMSVGMAAAKLSKFNNHNRAICSEFALEIFEKLGIVIPKTNKAYFPAEWKKWEGEDYFRLVEWNGAV